MSTTDSPSREVLTSAEACEQLRIHRNTMIAMLDRGEFPNAFRTAKGGPWRIPQSDIDDFRKRSRP